MQCVDVWNIGLTKNYHFSDTAHHGILSTVAWQDQVTWGGALLSAGIYQFPWLRSFVMWSGSGQWSKIAQIMVHQGNRRILAQSGFNGSFMHHVGSLTRFDWIEGRWDSTVCLVKDSTAHKNNNLLPASITRLPEPKYFPSKPTRHAQAGFSALYLLPIIKRGRCEKINDHRRKIHLEVD